MLERIFHFLRGSARFEIQGDSSRFFNIAAKSGFDFWGFSKESDRAGACCRAKEYKRLRPLARRCGARLRCVEKDGVPFYVRRLWLRKGLLLGIACGAGIYWFLSGFVWGVSVSGADSLSSSLILDAARENGVYLGARQTELSPKLAGQGILSDLPQLKWVTVNTDGCFAEIAVVESQKKPEITDDEKWSNIVAAREGSVVMIEAERGRPEVALGDTVEKGDLLISGLYHEKLKEWAPVPKDPYDITGAARGSVTAETYREFTVQVSRKKREQVKTGEKLVHSYLHVFGLRIPLGFHTIPEEDYKTYTETRTLRALGTELPLAVEKEVYELVEEESRVLEDEELKEAALHKLREAQRSEIAPGGSVLKEELTYSFPEGMCILSAKCRCREEIGVVQEILVNQTKSE